MKDDNYVTMQLRTTISILALSGSFLGTATPACALYNNVYVVAEPELAGTWLGEMIPVSSEAPKREQAIQTTVQQPTIEAVTGDVHFSPNPGATFQYNEEEFSRFREVFKSDY